LDTYSPVPSGPLTLSNILVAVKEKENEESERTRRRKKEELNEI
jgi:hypothetical protein